MRIIDLFNKVVNGEDVPKVIKYNNTFYEFDKKLNDYTCSGYRLFGNELEETYILIEHLNDEVEILDEPKDNFTGWKMYQDGEAVCSINCSPEEDKTIEKIKVKDMKIQAESTGNYCYSISQPMKIMINKLNELIDEVNKLI